MLRHEALRPERMYRRGRGVDQNFDPQEDLYFRFPPLEEEGESDFLPSTSIKFPDQSVNRGKYSEPQDVIFDFPTWGVAGFKVMNVPPSLQSEGGPVYEFKVVHMPEETNYAHSEVQVSKAGLKHSPDLKVPPNVKKRFRVLLMEKTRIIRRPSSALKP